MKTVRIAGVPEHFNLPWHMAMEEGAFEERGIKVQWEEVPEGTGRMCKMLRENETDLAVILTEGITRDIVQGNPSKIAQVYVASPLIWGIHVAASSNYHKIKDLRETKAAISRFGSGSHLMSYVHAAQKAWPLDALAFEVVNTLDGAVEALQSGQADYFLWERFTTQPLVDNGTFRRIGDCPTPWPCFVIAVTDHFLETNGNLLKHVLAVINTYTREFRHIPSIDRTIANRYQQELDDVRTWLSLTEWGQQPLDSSTVMLVQEQLAALDLLKKPEPSHRIITAIP